MYIWSGNICQSTTSVSREWLARRRTITDARRGLQNYSAFSGWRANASLARTGWCGMTITFSKSRRRVVTMRQRRAKCWCARGGTAASASSSAERRYAGWKFLHRQDHARLMGHRRALWPRVERGNGHRQQIIRGGKQRSEGWRSVKGEPPTARRKRRDRRWPCPPLRPKRSALRAPQGFAPGKASDPQTPQTQNSKRGHF